MEREKNDLLLIAHESVLRVLYGYFMACDTVDIPTLDFPRNEIIEIVPASYSNKATRITIPGLPPETIPGSPEDIRIPVPPSGAMTPIFLPDSSKGPATPIPGGSTSPCKSGSPQPGLLVSRAVQED